MIYCKTHIFSVYPLSSQLLACCLKLCEEYIEIKATVAGSACTAMLGAQ